MPSLHEGVLTFLSTDIEVTEEIISPSGHEMNLEASADSQMAW